METIMGSIVRVGDVKALTFTPTTAYQESPSNATRTVLGGFGTAYSPPRSPSLL